jgi:4-diphosphocytidyl-2-C-methyl-D-erythritol kinase
MICFPNAKINLGLNVVSKRPDGYHNIETVFYPVPLQDALEVTGAAADSFRQTGMSAGFLPAEDNLAVKAMNLLKARYSLPPLEVHLLKAIPFGAGLGGGSSDAAFMLKLLNSFLQLNIPVEQLEEMAAALGADCPFFIRNTPVFATATGNLFEPVSLSLKGYFLCLVKPGIAVSTPGAYAMVTPRQPERSLKDVVRRPVSEWKNVMVNDFEESVFQKYPLIGQIKEELYRAGAVYASMSGSGSSVYGLFESPANLKSKYPSYFVWEGSLGGV